MTFSRFRAGHFRLGVPSFAFVTSFLACTACAPGAEEDDVAGSESSISRVPGSATGSTIADPSKEYLRRRNLDNMGRARAIDSEALTLARRVDGIIANKPADGYVTVEELVAIEKAPHYQLLFPAEKAALPRIWDAMAIGNVAPVVNLAGAGPGDKTLKDRIATKLTPPSPLVPATLPISSLRYDRRSVASRIELAFDDDNDASTISPADVAAAKAAPASFTQAELGLMDGIISEQRAKGTSSASASLVVPYAGVREEYFGKAGPFEILRDRQLDVLDKRGVVTTQSRWGGSSTTLNVDFYANETVHDYLLFNGKVAIVALFSTTNDSEYLVGNLLGDDISEVPSGRYYAQVFTEPALGPVPYEGGACATDGRVFERRCGNCGVASAVCIGGVVSTFSVCQETSATCPPYGALPHAFAGWYEIELGPNERPAYHVGFSEIGETVKLRSSADFDVMTASGSLLAPWLGYAVPNPSHAEWVFGPFDPGHVGDKTLSATELAALTTATVSLPVGRYPLTIKSTWGGSTSTLDGLADQTTLDVYPNDIVMLAAPDGTTRRLLSLAVPTYDGPSPLVTEDGKDPVVQLDPKTGVVTSTRAWSSPRTLTLTADLRL